MSDEQEARELLDKHWPAFKGYQRWVPATATHQAIADALRQRDEARAEVERLRNPSFPPSNPEPITHFLSAPAQLPGDAGRECAEPRKYINDIECVPSATFIDGIIAQRDKAVEALKAVGDTVLFPREDTKANEAAATFVALKRQAAAVVREIENG